MLYYREIDWKISSVMIDFLVCLSNYYMTKYVMTLWGTLYNCTLNINYIKYSHCYF